jgi:hypothetical protein
VKKTRGRAATRNRASVKVAGMILQTDRPLRYALRYASLSFSVFPAHAVRDGICTCRFGRECQHPGKHPWTRHGVRAASSDRRQIERWWKKHPGANVAIATGEASGIVAIDVDPRNNGDESFDILSDRLGRLPETVQAATGGGGRHLLFQHPGRRVKNRQGITAGVDVKGEGGYIVVAPSVHESGNRYRWLRDPWTVHPAPLSTCEVPLLGQSQVHRRL